MVKKNKFVKYIIVFFGFMFLISAGAFASSSWAVAGAWWWNLTVFNSSDKSFFEQTLQIINVILSIFYWPFWETLIKGFLSNLWILSVINPAVITLFSILISCALAYLYMFAPVSRWFGKWWNKNEYYGRDDDGVIDDDYERDGRWWWGSRWWSRWWLESEGGDYDNGFEEDEWNMQQWEITSLLWVLKNSIIMAKEKWKNITKEVVMVLGIIFMLIMLDIGLSTSVWFQAVVSFDEWIPWLISNIALVFFFVIWVVWPTKTLLIDTIIKSSNNNKDDTMKLLAIWWITLLIIAFTIQSFKWLFNYFKLHNASNYNVATYQKDRNLNTIDLNNFWWWGSNSSNWGWGGLDLNNLLK